MPEWSCRSCGVRRSSPDEPPPGWLALGGDPAAMLCDECAALSWALVRIRGLRGDPRPPTLAEVSHLRRAWRELSRRPLVDPLETRS